MPIPKRRSSRKNTVACHQSQSSEESGAFREGIDSICARECSDPIVQLGHLRPAHHWTAFRCSSANALLHRVQAIAQDFSIRPLPADFNVLHCRGYFHDILPENRLGLVFSFPPSVPARLQPLALIKPWRAIVTALETRRPYPSLQSFLFGLRRASSRVFTTSIVPTEDTRTCPRILSSLSTRDLPISYKLSSSSSSDALASYCSPRRISLALVTADRITRKQLPNIESTADIDRLYLYPVR